MSGFDQFPLGKIGTPFITFLVLLSLVMSLDSYALNSGAAALRTDPELSGPENLCIVFGGVIGTFSGGGDPDTDIYSWRITTASGEVLFDRTGGRQFDEIKVSFNQIGSYTVELSVRRGTAIIYEATLRGEVTKGPEIALLPDYLLCGVEPVELIAIDEDTPNLSEYSFIWRDAAGNVVGNQNKFYTLEEGRYFVDLFLAASDGSQNCLISGNAYVGPSLDFNVLASSSRLCAGSTVQLSTDTPISGEWFLQRPGSTQKVPLGNAYSLSLDREALTDIGIYTASFVAIDPLFPDCPSERTVTFEVLQAPELSILEIQRPEDCADPTGIFEIKAIGALDSLIVPELNYVQTNLAPGQVERLDQLLPQIYTVSAYSNGCEFTTLMILETEDPPTSPNPPTQVTVDYTYGQESCTGFDVSPGWINLDFPEGKIDGEYRILALNSGTVRQGNIQDQDSLRIELPDGTYFFELKIDGCTYPIEEFTIANQPQVRFSVPERVNICDSYALLPQTGESLEFTLTFPDGSQETLNSGRAFTLTEGGSYTLRGRSRSAGSGDCPRQTTFTATVSQPIVYEAVLIEEDCFGNKVYEAQLENVDPKDASIRWLDEEGRIVGRNETFYPTAVGNYQLVVQPLASGFCPITPVKFEVEPPVFEVDVDLTASKICPDPAYSIIELETNREEVTSVEWIFYDLANQREDLDQFKDQFEIQVDKIGAYEAVVFNALGCEIGRNFINVELSTILSLPEVGDRVGVCSKSNTIPPLDPGDYESYAWYFEEALVSTSRRFKPTEVGSHTLLVRTVDGCEFVKQFETYQVCDFEVVFPNALILGDANRDFRVVVSEGVTEAELLILNRQGALIHRDLVSEFVARSPILHWDGTSEGRRIPLGTYVVVLFLRNTEFGFDEKVTGSLLVLE